MPRAAKPKTTNKFKIGTHVSVYWEADGLRYPARVITAPNGQKRTKDLKDQVYVKFKEAGTWDLVDTKHVTELKDDEPVGIHEDPIVIPDDDMVAVPKEDVVELIAKEWKSAKPTESSILFDLMRLAYLTEGHGTKVIPMMLWTPMAIQLTHAYTVARSNNDPQWLLGVLSDLNAPPTVVIPQTYVVPEEVQQEEPEESVEDSEESDEQPPGVKRRRIESFSDSSDGSKTRYGAPIDTAQRVAKVLTTPVTSAVQHQRARDAFAEVLIAMDGKADLAKQNTVALHYAGMLLSANKGFFSVHVIGLAVLADSLRAWEKSGHLAWQPDTRPSTRAASAIAPVLNNLPGARYVLWRAVWDMTDTMRGDISPTTWELLTCAEFPVDLGPIPTMHDQKCGACNKTRTLTKRFTWSLGDSMLPWNTGKDCACRISLARYAHCFVQQVETDAHDPPCDVNKYIDEWDLISKRISRVMCGDVEDD